MGREGEGDDAEMSVSEAEHEARLEQRGVEAVRLHLQNSGYLPQETYQLTIRWLAQKDQEARDLAAASNLEMSRFTRQTRNIATVTLIVAIITLIVAIASLIVAGLPH